MGDGGCVRAVARAGGGAHRGGRQGDHLHLGRDGEQQHGHQRDCQLLPGAEEAHHHDADGPQVRAGLVPVPAAARVRGDVLAGWREWTHQPRAARGGDPRGHSRRLRHGGQQRDWSGAAAGGDWANLPCEKSVFPHGCGAGGGQDSDRRRKDEYRLHVHLGPQDLRPEGYRSDLHSAASSRADGSHHQRRRTGARAALRHAPNPARGGARRGLRHRPERDGG
mmetsp:Transcript_12349/g.40596  ORF Transcript_12349/g.40596 Transcript_12349/m.40596 type:complete len:222 (-) Transcript_12349:2166-2831(-)